jgi:hypothetical protein
MKRLLSLLMLLCLVGSASAQFLPYPVEVFLTSGTPNVPVVGVPVTITAPGTTYSVTLTSTVNLSGQGYVSDTLPAGFSQGYLIIAVMGCNGMIYDTLFYGPSAVLPLRSAIDICPTTGPTNLPFSILLTSTIPMQLQGYLVNVQVPGTNFNANYNATLTPGGQGQVYDTLPSYITSGTIVVNLLDCSGASIADSISFSPTVQPALSFVINVCPGPNPVYGSNTVYGVIRKDSLPVLMNEAIVYLIRLDTATVNGSLTQILIAKDSTYTRVNGDYVFDSIPAGTWTVKAALSPFSNNYSTTMPTYYVQGLMWNQATYFVLPNITTAAIYRDITLINGVNLGGPGFIGGNVSQGANKTNGASIEGVHVYLLNASGTPLKMSLSDVNGDYSFSNLPYGSYQIMADMLNRVPTPINVTLSPTNQRADGVNIIANSNSVTAISGELAVTSLKMFPNPVQNILNITLNADRDMNLTARILDLQGRTIQSVSRTVAQGNDRLELDLSSLTPGIYMLNLNDGAGQKTFRVLKAD